MDVIDIYKKMGLNDKEIEEIINNVFKTNEEKEQILSEEKQYLLHQEEHKKQVMSYLSNFNELSLTEDNITYHTVDIIYAKIMFLESIGIKMNSQTQKYILLNEDEFYKKFGITNEELLKLFPYDEYEKNIKSK